jgi:O-antigen ligase
VTDLFLAAFLAGLLVLGFQRPFLWVLAYLYVDIVAPQKYSWFLLASLPVSQIVFILAFGGWLLLDDKRDSRFTLRQGILVLLLGYCGLTTWYAQVPEYAWEKWAWVWKALVFAIFLPLTLRTRLRIEATALVMVLSASALIVAGGIKTLAGGGGYGTLRLLVDDNTGLNEGSIISTVAIAIIPLIAWLARHGTVFNPDRWVKLYALALGFACLLIPIGTQARTGLVCLAVLAVLALRYLKRRILYLTLAVLVAAAAVPFLPQSFTQRMETIENHRSDQSASTLVEVWRWTLRYAADNPFGGGFEVYRTNRLKVEVIDTEGRGNSIARETRQVEERARAFHSSYFEMLGEQGWPGLALWLLLHGLGVWQMERVYRRYRSDPAPGDRWIAPLAAALQQAQIVYLVGSAFVGIAFQPFCYMLIALQCGLWSWLRRRESSAGRPAAAQPLPRADATARPAASPGVA